MSFIQETEGQETPFEALLYAFLRKIHALGKCKFYLFWEKMANIKKGFKFREEEGLFL